VKQQVDHASRWIYSGIWAVLVRWFRVPNEPPALPGGSADSARSFRPAEGFLRYLKFYFWIGLVIIDGLILLGWLAIAIAFPVVGIVLALPALALAVLPDIVVYIAIHLRYDTTWYVVSDRSLRIRRGIWLLHERRSPTKTSRTYASRKVRCNARSASPTSSWKPPAAEAVHPASTAPPHSSCTAASSKASTTRTKSAT
jgi:hypothetical protein